MPIIGCKAFLAGAMLAASLAGSASATTYTFDLRQDGSFSNQTSHNFYSNPLGLSTGVTGSHYRVFGSTKKDSGTIDVEANAHGLNSCNSNEKCSGGFSQAIDSKNADEIMHFLFSKAVRLTSVTLGWFGGSGWYDVFSGDTLVGNTKNGPINYPSVASNIFSIGTRTFGCGTNCKKESAIRIKSITVETIDVPPVPLPAALPLLAAGLGGLGFIGRRKKKAA